MRPIRVPPTRLDVDLADIVSRYARPAPEKFAKALTWGADERVLCAVAAGWWLYCRFSGTRRRESSHILLTTVVSAMAPHALKGVFDQTRPDRRTIIGHLRGVPLSGKRSDAFPSGHAVHIGALASAASVLPTKQRNTVWAAAAGLSVTRIVVLAHWTTDVLAGLAVGCAIERGLRWITGYGPAAKR
jgi:undecaprenyl-diphosphatase